MSRIDKLRERITSFKKRAEERVGAAEKTLDKAEKVLESLSPIEGGLAGAGSLFMASPASDPKCRKLGPRQGPCDLKESAPVGSFDRVEDDIRACLKDSKKILFPDMIDPYPYMQYAFPEHIIVSLENKYYEIAYTIDMDGKCTFGRPIEVEQLYVPSKPIAVRESIQKTTKTFSQEIRESGIELTGQSKDVDLDVEEFFSIKESKYDAATGDLEIVIIECGTNPLKKRHYPDSTIQEAAPHFSGLKMYLNHPTKKEEAERPERDLRDWVSTITESWYENGKAMGRVSVHDDWLRERLMDPVARQHIGVSINTGGKVVMGKVNGEEMQIVEKITLRRSNGPASVDWVTEAGARGRVSRTLKESQSTTKEKTMDLKEATFADLQRENPDLVKELTESIRKELSGSDEVKKLNAQLKEAQDKVSASELKEKQAAQALKVNEWLKESKLPDPAKTRVSKKIADKVYADEKELRESFDNIHKEEAEYVNLFSSKGKIKMGAASAKTSGEGSIRESAAADLSARMGIKDAKEGDEE